MLAMSVLGQSSDKMCRKGGDTFISNDFYSSDIKFVGKIALRLNCSEMRLFWHRGILLNEIIPADY